MVVWVERGGEEGCVCGEGVCVCVACVACAGRRVCVCAYVACVAHEGRPV